MRNYIITAAAAVTATAAATVGGPWLWCKLFDADEVKEAKAKAKEDVREVKAKAKEEKAAAKAKISAISEIIIASSSTLVTTTITPAMRAVSKPRYS